MQLWALSDLHIGFEVNRNALSTLPAFPDDWLIVAGDVGETEAELRLAWEVLAPRFRKLLWVPGNHELWTTPKQPELAGVARYERFVAVCREYGVVTPEDPYPVWEGPGGPAVLAPLFVLYDYSFSPDGLDPEGAKRWAREAGIECADEHFLKPVPYPSIQDWCAARVSATEARLAGLPAGQRSVLINHFPLRRDLVRLYRIPRFSPWCGTRRTEDWHVRFRADVVVSGHLHFRGTDWRDGTRFEEVSLGYPNHWNQAKGLAHYLRPILPAPAAGT